MKNHERIARDRPDAYAGGVLMIGEDESTSVVAAADCLDLPRLVRRFRQCAISEEGLDCLSSPYRVPSDRLFEMNWVDHMREKTWMDIDDFEGSYGVAKQYFEIPHGGQDA